MLSLPPDVVQDFIIASPSSSDLVSLAGQRKGVKKYVLAVRRFMEMDQDPADDEVSPLLLDMGTKERLILSDS